MRTSLSGQPEHTHTHTHLTALLFDSQYCYNHQYIIQFPVANAVCYNKSRPDSCGLLRKLAASSGLAAASSIEWPNVHVSREVDSVPE